MVLEQLDIHMSGEKRKTQNLDTDLTSFTKTNSKWIIGLNAKCKIIKLLKDNTGENLDDVLAMAF